MTNRDIELMGANRIIDVDEGDFESQPSGAMAVYAMVIVAVLALGAFGWWVGPVIVGWMG